MIHGVNADSNPKYCINPIPALELAAITQPIAIKSPLSFEQNNHKITPQTAENSHGHALIEG
jgi:hypothetical protein